MRPRRRALLMHLMVLVSLLLSPAAAAVQPSPGVTPSPAAYLPLIQRPEPAVASARGPDPFLSPLPTPEATPLPPPPSPTPPPELLPSPSGDLYLPYLNLEITAQPQAAPPGEAVTLRWRLEHRGEQALEGALLLATLPANLEVTPSGAPSPWRYDPARRALTWAMGRLEPGAALEAQAQIKLVGVRVGDAVAVPAELRRADGTRIAQAEVSVGVLPPAPEVHRLGPEGGQVVLEEGRVTLTFPPGALAEPVEVYARPLGRPTDAPVHLHRAYEFTVKGQDGQGLHAFNRPLLLTVRDPEGDPTLGRLFLLDEGSGRWEMLPTRWDPALHALVAEVPHLSTLAEGTNFYGETMPSLRGLQPDRFTGAIRFQYPIPLPPGRGGLTPRLALEFDSHLRGRDKDPGFSSVLGTGWRLSVDSYRYWTPHVAGSPQPTWRMDGIAYTQANVGSTLYLQEAPEWRIVGSGGSSVEADAYAPDGRRYHFARALSDWYCDGTTLKPRTDKWMLQYISDPVGNRVDFIYDSPLPVDPAHVRAHSGAYGDRVRTIEVYCDGTERVKYLSQINLTQVRYNGGQTTIDFTYAITRTDAPIQPSSTNVWAFYTTRLLTGITIRQAGQFWAGYRLEYDFFNHHDPSKRRYALRAIYRCRDEALTQCLPPVRFANTPGENTQLVQVDNGYGGQLDIGYDGAGRVASRTVRDLITGQADTWGYAYDSPHYDGLTVVGYRKVTETLPESLGPGNTIYYEFEAGNGIDAARRGKEKLRRVKVGHVIQLELWRTWVGIQDGVYAGKLIRLGEEEARLYDPSGASYQAQKTQYFYDQDRQGGVRQYGLLTRILEYSDAGSTLYRTIERWYYPRDEVANGRYLVSYLAQEVVRDGAGACRGQTRFVYDGASGPGGYTTPPTQGLLKEVWRAGHQGTACDANWVRAVAYGYDAWGNRISETAPNGTVTAIAYDGTFRAYPLSVAVQPSPGQGPTLTTAYRRYGLNADTGGAGLVGQLQQEIDPNGAITRYTYDGFGRLTEVRRPGVDFSHPATERYLYTDAPAPRIVRHGVRDDLNGEASPAATYREDWTIYGGLGDVIQTQEEGDQPTESLLVSLRYNALGQVARQTLPYLYPAAPGSYRAPDWSRPQRQYAYDGLGRLIQVTHPDGTRVRHFYDRRRVATLDENGHQTIRERDPFGRLIAVRQYQGVYTSPAWEAIPYATATYAYDVRDHLTDVWDPAGNRIQLEYDLLGRKLLLRDPDLGTWQYAYDAVGNLIRQTDAQGQRVCLYYDGLNRLLGKHYRTDDACPSAHPPLAVRYRYDDTSGGNAGLGRRTGMEDPSGWTQWIYDARGRVIAEVKVIGGVGFTTRYAYRPDDRLWVLTYPDGEMVVYRYNARGLADGLTSPGEWGGVRGVYVSQVVYNPLGQPLRLTYGDGAVITYGYHPQHYRLTAIQAPGVSLSYAYDPAGNVQSITDGGVTTTFTYDALGRLEGASGGWSASYAYSPEGNLLSKVEGGVRYTLSYPGAGQPRPHAPRAVNGQPYTYDANGRLIGRPGQSLAYNAEGRLTQAVVGGQTITYTYDGDGHLVRRVGPEGTTLYVGEHYEVFVPAVLPTPTPSPPTPTPDPRLRRRAYLPTVSSCHLQLGGQGAQLTKYYLFEGRRIALRRGCGGPVTYFYHDHLGSVIASSGGEAARYWPYGAVRSGGVGTAYRFTGQRWDGGTGLYWYRSRWYDPAIGRFLQPDPLVPEPGNPQA
ncbi:MAG: RHS repeat-associated core domain-containing protein, partial [Anaerolineae bacterium]|nr:RHS repeat-associated core domain-containing protein [Anaerolineae bacterium]